MSGIDLIAEERDEAKAERDAAWDRVAVLERQLAATREHALPLTPTPYTGPATGVDLVDRLRGIYVVPVVGERRFDASAINLEAADRISELAEHAAALGLATARIRELEGERDELLGLVAGARWTDPNTGAEVRVGDTWKAKGAPSAIAASVTYEVLALKRRRDGTTWAHVITPSEFATTIPAGALVNRFAIVARIEKATKGAR